MNARKHLSIASTLLLLVSAPFAVAQDRTPADLTDVEIAHVAYTAGSIDIRYAHLALAVSKNPEVRTFAETMLRDHAAVNVQALALVKKLGITPKDNFLSQALEQGADDLVHQMQHLDSAEFDKFYANNEHGYHKTVNSVVGDAFIPNAENRDLKKLLRSALKTFKVHEGHAERMAAVVSR